MAKPGEYVKWSFLFENTESAMLMRIEFLVVVIACIFLLMSFLDMFRRQSRHSSIKYLLLVLDAISDSSFIYTIGLMQNAPFKKDLFSVWALILVNLRFNACFISAYGIPDQENTRLNESGKVVTLLGVAFLIGTQNSEFKHPIWVLWAMQQVRNAYLIVAYNLATISFLHGRSSPLVTAYLGTEDGICKDGDTTTMMAYKYLVSGDHIQSVKLKPPAYKFHLEVTSPRKRHLITLDKIWLPIDQGSHIKDSGQENGDVAVGTHENGDIGGRGGAQENAAIGGEGSIITENAGIGVRGSAEENARVGDGGNAGISTEGSAEENVGTNGRESVEENGDIAGGGSAEENAVNGGAHENAGINGRDSTQVIADTGGGDISQENVSGRDSAPEITEIGGTDISGRDGAPEITETGGTDIPRENADINDDGRAQEDAGIGGGDSTQGNGDIRTPWMKDMGLSFALYRLLRCRFDDLTLPADSIPPTRRLIYDIIGKKEDGKYSDLDKEIKKHSERAFRIVKLELAFLSDYFYTRYPILFWNGFPIFVAWHPLLTIALIAWLARDIHKLYKPKVGETAHVIHGVNVDICITWAFMGIIVLKESWKMVTYLLSDWTKVMLLCKYTSAQSLRVRYIPEFLIKILCTPGCRILHRWHNKIGQYDFIQSFGYNPWNILHYLTLGLLPKDIKGAKVQGPTKLPEDVKSAVVKSLCLLKFGKNSLESGLPDDDNQFAWTFKLKTWSHSILVWHIATSLCEIELAQHYNASLTISEVLCAVKTALNCFSSQPYVIKKERIEGALQANYVAAVSLSRYCAYLLVKEPDLLPDSYLTGDEIFQNTLDDAVDILKGCDTLQSIYRTLIREGEPLDPQQGPQDGKNMEGWQAHPNMVLAKAAKLAWSLIHEFSDEKIRWKILAGVWADILVHTAPSWNSAAHKKCLATGGEFITHIWVILSHCDVRRSERWPAQPAPQDAEETAAPRQEPPAVDDRLVPQEEERDDARVPTTDTLQEQGHPAVNKWARPPAGFLKLNVSAGFDEETGSGAFGVILRDSEGMFVAACSRFIPHALDAPSMEAEALLEGLKLAEMIGCKSITAESDLEGLVNTIASPSLLTRLAPGAATIYNDCLAHLAGFSSATVVNCPWEANAAAFELGNYSFNQRLSEIWKDQPPDFLINTLANDETRWTRPPAGFLKLNVGAAFSVETSSGAFGVIIRDSEGQFKASYSRFKPYITDFPSMQAEALLEGLKLARTIRCKRIRCKYIIAESDSEEVVNAIANPLSYRASGAAIINDCRAKIRRFRKATVVHCQREANAAAYELVRYSFTHRLSEIWKDQPPGFLIGTIADEVRSSKPSPPQTSPQDAEETVAPEGMGGENHAPPQQEQPAADDRLVPYEAARDDARVPSTAAGISNPIPLQHRSDIQHFDRVADE